MGCCQLIWSPPFSLNGEQEILIGLRFEVSGSSAALSCRVILKVNWVSSRISNVGHVIHKMSLCRWIKTSWLFHLACLTLYIQQTWLLVGPRGCGDTSKTRSPCAPESLSSVKSCLKRGAALANFFGLPKWPLILFSANAMLSFSAASGDYLQLSSTFWILDVTNILVLLVRRR